MATRTPQITRSIVRATPGGAIDRSTYNQGAVFEGAFLPSRPSSHGDGTRPKFIMETSSEIDDYNDNMEYESSPTIRHQQHFNPSHVFVRSTGAPSPSSGLVGRRSSDGAKSGNGDGGRYDPEVGYERSLTKRLRGSDRDMTNSIGSESEDDEYEEAFEGIDGTHCLINSGACYLLYLEEGKLTVE
ncbi:hypothetical protein ABW20_dc0102249 [Dactylellina cionopaga]|nr:hypothetical protein ABW20_dc0102249 [Dactylellina cionopaga]